jgi:hypothetical protein
MEMRALQFILPTLASVLVGACSTASHVANAPAASTGAAANSLVPAPRPSILGCVESRELKDYVRALDAQREQSRRAALAAVGATPVERRGLFGAAGAAALDQSYEAGGKRFAVAAELAPHFEPRAALAKQGPLLRRIDERPRAHAVDVLVCGVERCPQPRAGQRVAPRPVVVELAPGESWGGSLELANDNWWARVRYDRREACAAPE